MKRFFKVLGVIFSIIGFLVTVTQVMACIVLKNNDKSYRKFVKDAYSYGYNYID